LFCQDKKDEDTSIVVLNIPEKCNTHVACLPSVVDNMNGLSRFGEPSTNKFTDKTISYRFKESKRCTLNKKMEERKK
jgi:hypothetical protein